MRSTTIRSYSELMELSTLEERFAYLSLRGLPFDVTFGNERYVNQRFYTSREWREVRREVVIRDMGLDLGMEDRPIPNRPLIHHMNPMCVDDIRDGNPDIFDPEFLITVSHKTHNAIHYGDISQLYVAPLERRPGDTRLW